MSQYELAGAGPVVGRTVLTLKGGADGTVTVPPKDRHLKQVEYRLHCGLLREIAIHYRHDRIRGV
jgi:hypothetical protein